MRPHPGNWLSLKKVGVGCIALFVVGSALTACLYFGSSLGWVFWVADNPDLAWAGTESARFAVVRKSLERYQKDHGAFPYELSELVPKYLPGIPPPHHPPCGSGGEAWRYETFDNRSAYCVWTSANHWVSSFDVLVLESNQDYSLWEGNPTTKVGDWRYVVGGSSIVDGASRLGRTK